MNPTADVQAWTRDRLLACPAENLPIRMGRYRRTQREAPSVWKHRLISLVDSGHLKLGAEARPQKAQSKDPYDALSPASLDGLRTLNITSETAIRRLCAPPSDYLREIPLQRGTLPLERDGLGNLRDQIEGEILDTYHTRLEEADCNLACATCPAAQALACGYTNLTSFLGIRQSLVQLLGVDPEPHP